LLQHLEIGAVRQPGVEENPVNIFRKMVFCGLIALPGLCIYGGQASAATTSAVSDLPKSKDTGNNSTPGNCSANPASKECVKTENFEGGPSAKGKPTPGKVRESPTGDGNNPMHIDEKNLKSK
jgi:hypothetical protein